MTLEPGGWLCVEGIDIDCTIGVTERERATKQRIVLNLKLKVDFTKVAVSDAIRDSIDYRVATRRVIAECEKSSFQLIETLASHLTRMIFSESSEIEKVVMEVWKPGALSSAKNVGAVIVASRDSR
jgi:FolB domain-containing protein